jgi:putative sterol carrier protein
MATLDECLQTIADLARRLDEVDESRRKSDAPDRTLSLHLTDIDEDVHGRLHGGQLLDVEVGVDGAAQLKGSISSDDLIALAEGKLKIAEALLTGRLKVSASWRDLLELRKYM